MGHIADEDIIYDLDDDPIVKVHLHYMELFGKDCTDEVARQILKDQQDSIDLFSKIESGTRYMPRLTNLKEYIEDWQSNKDHQAAMDAYAKKLAAMTPEERYLAEEGFTRPESRWLHNWLKTDVVGKKVYQIVLNTKVFYLELNQMEEYTTLLNMIITSILDGIIRDRTCTFSLKSDVYGFLNGKQGLHNIAWFAGILGDGERTYRTIHKIFLSYLNYLECPDKPLPEDDEDVETLQLPEGFSPT